MKKLHLDLDSLSVEAFETNAELKAARRTVLANEASQALDTCPPESGWSDCPTGDRFDRMCWASGQPGCSQYCPSGEVHLCATDLCDSEMNC
jgi:hypothetical protein